MQARRPRCEPMEAKLAIIDVSARCDAFYPARCCVMREVGSGGAVKASSSDPRFVVRCLKYACIAKYASKKPQ